MNYKIIGDSDAPIVDITLSSGETIKVERGAMAFMQNVSLQAETNSKKSGFGGLVGAIARSAVSGESMFITGAFLACDDSVFYNIKRQDIGKAFFGGTGGLFVMETEGNGQVLINAFGDLVVLDITPNAPMVIDNEHVVAWDASLDYNIRVASGTFGFMSGEGLVNEFHGTGKVIIQTRNVHSLADAVAKYIPTSNN